MQPLLSTKLFHNRISNLGLVTQNVQWLMLMGTSFVVSAYLQVIRGYNAIQTGVIFTAATLGILASSLVAGRLAKRFRQRALIFTGFVTTIAGVAFLLAIVKHSPSAWSFAPGLLLIGLGLGVMLTPSVNMVQSAFPETQQGEISGLSRSVSNLGSCLGTAIAGTILVSGLTTPTKSYALAMIAVAIIGLVGLGATAFLPKQNPAQASPETRDDASDPIPSAPSSRRHAARIGEWILRVDMQHVRFSWFVRNGSDGNEIGRPIDVSERGFHHFPPIGTAQRRGCRQSEPISQRSCNLGAVIGSM